MAPTTHSTSHKSHSDPHKSHSDSHKSHSDLQCDQPPAYVTVNGHRYRPTRELRQALLEFQAFSANEKTKFLVGIAQAVSDPEVTKALEATSNESAAAIAAIDAMFIRISSSLQVLPYGQELFVKDFDNIKQTFRTTVDDSRKLAVNTSIYAKKFDLAVIAYCADPNVSVDERKRRIQNYIDDATEIQDQAEKMRLRFEGLKDSFGTFTGKYSKWADEEEGEINATLKALKDEIDALGVKIAEIDAEIAVLDAEMAAHKVANAAWWFFLSPIAGAVAMAVAAKKAAVRAEKMASLVASKLVPEQEQREKETEVKNLEAKLSNIEAIRAQLVAQGKLDLEIFNDNVTYLQNVFLRARNSALEIRGWLEEGADWADVPDVVADYVNEGVRLYTAMAKYLTDYANGIVAVQTSFK